jgi:hypothetical protein
MTTPASFAGWIGIFFCRLGYITRKEVNQLDCSAAIVDTGKKA